MSDNKIDVPALVGQELLPTIPSGSPLESYMIWACQESPAPPLYHLATFLALSCHELAQRGFRFELSFRRHPLSLWFALIGDSGSGKTEALQLGQDFAAAAWEDSSTTHQMDPWVEAEGSIAGMLEALHDYYDSSRGTTCCLLYHNEMSALFQSREPVAELLCRLADGHSFKRHTKEMRQARRRGHEVADRIVQPRLSMLAATTDAALNPHFGESKRGGGLFSRFWWIRANFDKDRIRGRRHPQGLEEALDEWRGWVVQLALAGDATGYDFVVSEEAEAFINAEFIEPQRAACDDGDTFNAVRIRGIGKTYVLAAIYASMAGRTTVRECDCRHALAMMQIMIGCAQATHDILGVPETVRLADKLERRIRAGGEMGCNRTELYNHVRTDKKSLDAALEMLIDQGVVVIDYRAGARGAGRARYFHVGTQRAEKIDPEQRPN